MTNGRIMHVYSSDGSVYYGNVMFERIFPMSEEEYDDFIKNIIKEHFPMLVGKKYHIIWSNNVKHFSV